MTPAGKRLPADQPVRDLMTSELSHSCLLEAGAGTGKTSVIVERVTEILKTEEPLDKIAVITFTEKAAGELKLRIRQAIERTLSGTGPGRWRAHLESCLEGLDWATISTIHSFAASLLRERPVEADVDPRFTVADELTSSMLMEETWDRWIEEEMTQRRGVLARALRQGISLRHLRDLAFGLAGNRDVAPGPGPGEGPDPRQTRDRILEGIDRLVSLAASCQDPGDRAAAQIRALDSRRGALQAARGEPLVSVLAGLPLARNAGNKANWRPEGDLAAVKELVGQLGETRADCVQAARVGFSHLAAGWIREGFLRHYQAAKDSRRLLDFSDLLILCRDMLVRDKAARVAFQRRFSALLVDEFQDTDPLQSEILFLLAADDPDQTDWKEIEPRPGKLFVVGDPKQSIYRFRRADIQTYEQVKTKLPTSMDGREARLRQNFRTVPSIIGWVNDVFGKVIVEGEASGYQPPYEPIEAFRPEPAEGQKQRPSRVLLLMPRDAAGLAEARADEVRRAEARHVIGLIQKARSESWPVHPRGGGDPRGLGYGDVALLFRSGSAMEIYEDQLREHLIPYRLSGGRRYYLRAEIRALQAVLAALENPHDPLAVVSALRCPIFGFSDEDLLAHAAGGGEWAYTRESAGKATPFERAFEVLSRLHEERNRRSIAMTLEALLDATGALALFHTRPDGEQRAANLLKAIDLARAHESLGGSTFGSFSRWLGEMARNEREEGEAPLTEEAEPEQENGDAGAIRILTVHKAKGLEFPMVILCDTAGKMRADSPVTLVERDRGAPRLEFRLGPRSNQFESAGYAAALEREKRRLEAESLRLHYVAATRARDYLVIPAFGGRSTAGLQAVLRDTGHLPAPDGGGEEAPALHEGATRIEGKEVLATRPGREPSRIRAEDAIPPDPALTLEKVGWRRLLTTVCEAPTIGRALRVPSAMESPPRPATRGGPRAEGSGRGIGVAVHAVLEKIDLASGRGIDLLSEDEAAAAGLPGAAMEVRDLVKKALGSPIVREALAAPRYFREMGFAVAGDTYLAEGRTDLVFESGGRLVIVDFKTDRVETPEEIAARAEVYRPQAAIYARAMAQITGLQVSRVVLHFIRPGVDRTFKIDDALLMMGLRLLETGSIHPA